MALVASLHDARRRPGPHVERSAPGGCYAATAGGGSNAEIATGLHMSVATAKAHISHILIKLGLGNRTQIALLAHGAELA
jgi:hypothetical protein